VAAPLVEAQLDTRNNLKHGRTRLSRELNVQELGIESHVWININQEAMTIAADTTSLPAQSRGAPSQLNNESRLPDDR
jgi:hypothetical protein